VVSDGVLTGVIRLGLLLSAIVEEDTRQMLNVGGVAGDSRENTLVSSIRTRLPWLTVNLGTTFLAAAAISLFESPLAHRGGLEHDNTCRMPVRTLRSMLSNTAAHVIRASYVDGNAVLVENVDAL